MKTAAVPLSLLALVCAALGCQRSPTRDDASDLVSNDVAKGLGGTFLQIGPVAPPPQQRITGPGLAPLPSRFKPTILAAPPVGWSGVAITIPVSCAHNHRTETAPHDGLPVARTSVDTSYVGDVGLKLYSASPGFVDPPSVPVHQPRSRLELISVPTNVEPSAMSWFKRDFVGCGQSYRMCKPRSWSETNKTLPTYNVESTETMGAVTALVRDFATDQIDQAEVRTRTLSVTATADGGLALSYVSSVHGRTGLHPPQTEHMYATTCTGTWHP